MEKFWFWHAFSVFYTQTIKLLALNCNDIFHKIIICNLFLKWSFLCHIHRVIRHYCFPWVQELFFVLYFLIVRGEFLSNRAHRFCFYYPGYFENERGSQGIIYCSC